MPKGDSPWKRGIKLQQAWKCQCGTWNKTTAKQCSKCNRIRGS